MGIKSIIKDSILNSDMYNQAISLGTVLTIAVDMVLALLLGILIYRIYKRYYMGVLYSSSFAFTLIGMTVLTCTVTLAISTNIVIALGMVGALSIVRYRTAVKEPLDIMYLFWAITMGITCGASMFFLAFVGMAVMLALVMFFSRSRRAESSYVLILHLSDRTAKEGVLSALKDEVYTLRSETNRGEFTELAVQISFTNSEKGGILSDKLRELPGVSDVTLLQFNGEYHG
ncbi:MAG: DUF4956 domain-containing protein [Lachnospiraceae bacterium]|nr:DUF4956 domain-containing protein [Lachnospiraceae bacterium]